MIDKAETDRPAADEPVDETRADPFAQALEGQARLVQAMFAPLASGLGDRQVTPEDAQHWALSLIHI